MDKPETEENNKKADDNETKSKTLENEESMESDDKTLNKSEFYLPRRYIIAVLCWSGLFIIHAMRVNIGITVVTILDNEPHTKVGSDEVIQNLPKVLWNSKMIGFLHSIFYIGFIITQIPGGYISRKSYVTKVFICGIGTSCLLNFLLPVGISFNIYMFTCFIRLCQGLSEGLVFPSLYKIMHNWFPSRSVHKYGGWIFGGMFAGPILGFPVDGIIIHYWKWQFVFYLHAMIGILWFFLALMLFYETPKSHPTISDNELNYISSHQDTKKKETQIPWVKIFSTPAVWAIVTSNFIKSWMFILMLTNEPAYLNQFQFSIVENGIYSAIPHVLKVMVASVSGYLADIFLNYKILSKTNVRKLFNTLGFGVEACMCFLLVITNSGVQAVIFLCIGIGFSGLAVSGWQINVLDIAPELSGVIAGIAASFGTLGGIISPIVIGILTHPQTLQNWQHSFILTGLVLTTGVIVFCIFGTAEKQNWDLEESIQLIDSK